VNTKRFNFHFGEQINTDIILTDRFSATQMERASK